MAESFGGAPGVALTVGIVGGVLVYSAIRNRSVADTLRSLIRGEEVTPRPGMPTFGTVAGGGGQSTGAAVAASAAGYVGKVPYRFGGASPDGWDCSGLVTWVLHHDHGLNLPSNLHTIAVVFYAWPGAVTVPRSECQAGDLVCWPSHIGIATDGDNMVNAPHVGALTRVDRIWGQPAPVIRRPKAYSGALVPAGTLAELVEEGVP